MSEIVFILGAGASKRCGVPLMNEFLSTARVLYSEGNLYTEASAFEQVFDGIGKLQSVHSKAQLGIYNIESVFAAFEMAHTLRQLGEYKEDQLKELISATKSLISTTIRQTVKLPSEPYTNLALEIRQRLHTSAKG
jgi:hypothetical protein